MLIFDAGQRRPINGSVVVISGTGSVWGLWKCWLVTVWVSKPLWSKGQVFAGWQSKCWVPGERRSTLCRTGMAKSLCKGWPGEVRSLWPALDCIFLGFLVHISPNAYAPRLGAWWWASWCFQLTNARCCSWLTLWGWREHGPIRLLFFLWVFSSLDFFRRLTSPLCWFLGLLYRQHFKI